MWPMRWLCIHDVWTLWVLSFTIFCEVYSSRDAFRCLLPAKQVVDKAASTKRLSKRIAFTDVFSFKSYVVEVEILANVHSANSTRFAEVGENMRLGKWEAWKIIRRDASRLLDIPLVNVLRSFVAHHYSWILWMPSPIHNLGQRGVGVIVEQERKSSAESKATVTTSVLRIPLVNVLSFCGLGRIPWTYSLVRFRKSERKAQREIFLLYRLPIPNTPLVNILSSLPLCRIPWTFT